MSDEARDDVTPEAATDVDAAGAVATGVEPSPGGRGSGRSAGPTRPRLDALGVAAHLTFVLVGGLLVYGMARSLVPAASLHDAAACRALQPEPRTGAAPDLALETLDGRAVSLSEFRGKFVVLNFWATYCEPCIEEWPELDTLGRRLEDRDDVVVLAVSVDPEKPDIEPYLRRAHLDESPVQVLWDPTAKANGEFGSTKIPDTFFVDREGQVHSAFINVRRWGRPAAFRCVSETASRS